MPDWKPIVMTKTFKKIYSAFSLLPKYSLLLLCLILTGTGCGRQTPPAEKCTVLLEDNDRVFYSRQIFEIDRYADLSFSVGVPVGERISSVNYDGYTLSARTGSSESYDYYTLTLHNVRYSAVIRLETDMAYTTIYTLGSTAPAADSQSQESTVGDNLKEGETTDNNTLPGQSTTADDSIQKNITGDDILIEENSPHLTFNTLPYKSQFTRDGYVQTGWNTMPDGNGLSIGFGSRIDHRNASTLTLYPEWLPATDASYFSYVLVPASDVEFSVCITGFSGDYSADIVIPSYIKGFPVTSIAGAAFSPSQSDMAQNDTVKSENGSLPPSLQDSNSPDSSQDATLQNRNFQNSSPSGTVPEIKKLYLPPTLQSIEPGAFASLAVQDLYLFDSLKEVSDLSFSDFSVKHLHLNAATAPVYSGSYFDTFSDKFDALKDLTDKRKLVLFCGSSARFGYDSTLLAAAFPELEIINMGVYAYSNMLPQADLVLSCMKEGDILLSSPELDAIDTQFCGETALDRETFALLESNYDMLASLDCTAYTKVFDALGEYLSVRNTMSVRSYEESASSYDEDGHPVGSPSYNRYGDYILYRENNFDRRTFGIKRAFYNVSHIRKQDFDGLNAVYDRFAKKGVTVLFTYSPRSRISISEDSTEESIKELDQTLREKLHATVISDIQDSLMDPLYFYGTDNHLSTEGAALRTRQVISDLRPVLQQLEE